MHPGHPAGYHRGRRVLPKDRGQDEKPQIYGGCGEHLPQVRGPVFGAGEGRIFRGARGQENAPGSL